MKRFVSATLLVLAAAAAASAEDRIAYANLELILTLMPAAADVNRQLDAYHKELAKGLDTKQAYAQQKLTEAQEAAASGVVSEAKLKEYETELRDLMKEIRESAVEADKKILLKQKELMQPVADKLQDTIRQVAVAEGYTYVLNMVDGAGTSIVLYGQEDRDLTRRIMEELGVAPPED